MLAEARDIQHRPENPLSRERERDGVRVPRARALRQNSTDAEHMLWQKLRSRQIDGVKFRRQHPVGSYFVDFACVPKRLAIELDGGQHAHGSAIVYDEHRTLFLKSAGWQVLRFWNHEVIGNLEGVLEVILHALREPTSPSPQPSPASGRGSNSALIDAR
ncbi:endonuclease domain-containing protein [Diaphorobacter aerolatus]|uniref:Endonuclease domain-containing protein n=1 Tax=Diaphorobacter aerolatus TaxID=1288495 RepID=A0A7H0GNT0_9BURK|nr:DUF559 domain-containing protein [Diaphorobacter aerolatus]QNP49946.1 endonuclease domain-containing protein [Diaphorobacter aerolatus]